MSISTDWEVAMARIGSMISAWVANNPIQIALVVLALLFVVATPSVATAQDDRFFKGPHPLVRPPPAPEDDQFFKGLQPNPSTTFNNRGNVYFEKGDYDHAIADYSEAIRLDPNVAIYYSNRGMAYSNKNDYDRAIADYSEAIRLDPNDAKEYRNRGVAYSNTRDYDRAIVDFNEAIRLDPNYASAYHNRGVSYNSKGNYDRAIADFNQAIQLDPNYAIAYYNRGLAYDRKADYERAITDYSEAIRLDPKTYGSNGSVHNERGVAYSNTHDYERAITDYSEAIRLDPNFAVAYINRGNAYLTEGRLEAAIADYSEAIRLGPHSAAAYNNRGTAFFKSGNYDRTIEDTTEAIRLDPKLSSAYNGRGSAYREKGDLARAMIDLEVAIRLNPSGPRPYFHRGLVYDRKGDTERALVDLRHSLELDPSQEDVRAAIARLNDKRYLISGIGPDGAKYSGEATVEKTGDLYAVNRTIAGQRLSGIAIEYTDFLAVSYGSGNESGLVLLSKNGDTWAGISAEVDGRQISAESWRRQTAVNATRAPGPTTDLGGQYVIFGRNPDSSTYNGEVAVERTGDTYQVVWTVGAVRLTGTGVGFRNGLAVAYRSDSGVRIALYIGEIDGWGGTWAKEGIQQTGTEGWQRWQKP
jgi:tetratricopeptide (TPR) repeat protein